MYQAVVSGAFRGLDSFLVQIEVDISEGLPCMDMIGYLANEVKESKERVRVGIKNSGYQMPIKRITISLTPADIRKDGSGFDLPMAIGILSASGEAEESQEREGMESNEKTDERCIENAGEKTAVRNRKRKTEEDKEEEARKREKWEEETLIIGELGLDGEVKPVKGVLPILLKAEKEGIKNCILPLDNMKEAENVKSIRLFPVMNLKQAYETFLAAGDKVNISYQSQNSEYGKSSKFIDNANTTVDINCESKMKDNEITDDKPDFSQIRGQQQARRAAEIAAAGFHNLLLFGPPGSGKSMIAERIPGILPKMSYEECLEVTQIYSVAGLLDAGKGLVTQRPYERPHHSITPVALTGGGAYPLPGAITLAHKGVLFLDELPEFGREKLDLLRQPLEEKKIRIIRNQYACDYSCDFMFVAAMNPCPCGYYPDRTRCNCKDHEVERYLKRVSGPILDRMDISVEVGKVEWAQLQEISKQESSETIRERVTRAHVIQRARQGKFNVALTNEELDRFATMKPEAESFLAGYFDRKQLSIRGYQRIRKLCRTIADLEEKIVIEKQHVVEAVLLNQGMEGIYQKSN